MAALPTESSCTDLFLTRRSLFDKMRQSGHPKLDEQVISLKKFIETRTKCPKSKVRDLHKRIYHFVSEFKKRWQGDNRKTERFLNNNLAWLDTSISFPDYAAAAGKNLRYSNVGRPKKSFAEVSDRTKRQRTEALRSEYATDELCYAAQMSLRTSQKVEASKLVKEVTGSTPNRAARYRTAFNKSTTFQKCQLSPEEALSMFVEAKLTRHQYNIIRAKDRLRFPSYKIIQRAKKDCYPNKEDITVTDTSVDIKLQSLLDHTTSRLLQVQRDVFESRENFQDLHLITKWGFDGSSGQSEYKQRFRSDAQSDASMFLSSLVPLRLLSGDPEGKNQVIIWENLRSSSTRFCRPIRFQFTHETTELALREKDIIESQVKLLVPTKIEINGQNIAVRHRLLLTMVDGKICNSLTETKSTQRCYICGLTSKDFNNIEKVVSTKIVECRLEFGLSVLHSWIRFFECLLHIAYRLPLQQWQARGDDNKETVARQKRRIQAEFKSQLGLIIDKHKPGYGSSNDGNTARRFFENADTSSNITGININIIKRFKTILTAVASGHVINVGAFKTYALETAKIFIEDYPWYPMPPTVHKVLIHGPVIIQKALLPIGQLSEEAQEASNKIFKKYREGYSRKCSREKTNEDVIHSLLVSSDPLISSMQQIQKKSSKLGGDVLQLLQAPGDNTDSSSTSEDQDSLSSDDLS